MIEIETLTKENSQLNMVVGQHKASANATSKDMDRERQQMQTRFAELGSKIEGLQTIHNETVKNLTEQLTSSKISVESLVRPRPRHFNIVVTYKIFRWSLMRTSDQKLTLRRALSLPRTAKSKR
jgi:hypothetical protein